MVKQILGFAHTGPGELRATQIKHVAREIVSVVTQTFPKSIVVEDRISSMLWAVRGNATQIHQVLLNLCVNARDAMPHGGMLCVLAENRRIDEAAAATLPGGRPGAWVAVEVSDTGTGIAPELLAKIWNPFFTTKGGKGTGLGLSTVRGIVATHGGFATIATEVGRGTTFTVYFPAIDAETRADRVVPPAEALRGHDELVLVVEDDAAFRNLIAAGLARVGYRVLACVDGTDALAVFNAHGDEVAVVVTDVDMPRLGGVALIRALRQLRPGLRVVAMSGSPSREDPESESAKVRQVAHAYLAKPFEQEALLDAMQRVLHPDEGS